mgnify:FL=1
MKVKCLGISKERCNDVQYGSNIRCIHAGLHDADYDCDKMFKVCGAGIRVKCISTENTIGSHLKPLARSSVYRTRDVEKVARHGKRFRN